MKARDWLGDLAIRVATHGRIDKRILCDGCGVSGAVRVMRSRTRRAAWCGRCGKAWLDTIRRKGPTV